MKRVLSWLCFIVALALWPQSAFAEETYYLSYDNGSGWQHSKETFTKSGNTWSATIPAGNGDSNGWYYLIIRNFNPGSNNDWHGTRFHGTDTGNDYEITRTSAKITKQDNIGKSLVIKGQKNKDVTVKFTLANDNGYEVNVWYEVESAPSPTVPASLYLYANLGSGWSYNTTPITKSGNKFTGSFSVTGDNGYVRFRTGNNTGDFYNADSKDKPVADGTTYNLSMSNDYCFKLVKGNWDFTVDFSATTPTVVFTKTGGDEPQPQPGEKTLYLSYSTGGSWAYDQPMAKSGKKYLYTFPPSKKVFYFITTEATGSTDFDTVKKKTGIHYWPVSAGGGDNIPVSAGDELSMHNGQAPNRCMESSAGTSTYDTIILDFTDSDDTPTIRFMNWEGSAMDPSDPRTRKNHLPLKPSDFLNADGSKRAHYFLVGTRMGDWRLQPEWELKSLGNNVVGIDVPRVMYTGLIGVAMVDNYADYSIGKYTRYNTNDQKGHDFAQDNKSANIYSKGVLEVYNGDSFREVPVGYDYCDRFFAKSSKSFDAEEDGGSKWYTTVKKSTGMVVNSIKVTLSNGVPSRIDFDVPSGDAAFDVSNYITFSLVGSEIRNWGMPDAAKSPRGMNSWQDGWVQYDPETGIPYRDAKGNLIYQTCFQPSWLDEHPSYFNMPIGDADNYRDFNYTSQSITMKNAKRFTADELKDDNYAAYYNRFNGGNGNLGGSQSVKGANYDFKEIIDSWDGSSHSDVRNANYECFVVKDMWMDGSFKVWTGWGGGLKKNEQSGASGDDYNNARWYYVNGGHGQEGKTHDVEGFDINCGGKDVKVYGTYQDVAGADFNINKLTYFKRVIVWYDPAKKFNGASAVQLIREMFGPQIKAFRGEYGHQIDREWNISALGLDSQDFEKPLNEYSVDLYRYDATVKDFVFVKNVQHEKRDGMTVKDFAAYQFGQSMSGDEHVIAGTDSQLSAGTYRYKVTVRINDSGEEKERDAWSNRVTLYEASQPVDAKAYQRTETENGNTLYSFDVVLDLDLKDGQVIDGDTEYTYNKLVSHYLIEVPDGTAATMNSALEVTMDGTEVEKPANGWFQNKYMDVYVDGKTTAESKLGYWLEIPVVENTPAKTLVFHNLIGATPQQVYNFDIYLRPKQDVEKVYAQANFEHTHREATLTIPGVGVKFVAGGVKPYTDNKPEEMLFGKKTPAKAMPMGSHDRIQSDVNAAENFQVVAPIHYTEANQLYAEFAVSEPAVTRSVRDNFAIRYKGASVQTDRDNLPELCASTAAAEVTAAEAFAGITRRECIDVTNLAQEATDIDADGNTYLTIATGAVVPVLAIADVEYRHEDNANAIRPLECSRAESNLSLALPVPQVEPQVRLTTNEQDATNNDKKRYYVHELYANLGLTNITDVKANYTVRPGFHLVPATAHNVTFSGSDCKAARGGVIAHEGLFGFTNDFFQSTYLEGYTPFNGIYDQTSDNWARLSANKGNIPVYVNYFWVQDKEATGENYRTGIPNLSGYVAYHYPFVVADNSGIAALAADDEHNMVTLTAVSPLDKAFVADEVMTAIGNVTADADWADAEFYNLQGIRVMNPVPGQVYLVRRGADVTKVLYR